MEVILTVALGCALMRVAWGQDESAAAVPSVNVCLASFQCAADLDCQLPGERLSERWACRLGKCAKVACIIDLECDKGLACLDNVCKGPRLSRVGGPCDITAGSFTHFFNLFYEF